jgi:hypothetical protein
VPLQPTLPPEGVYGEVEQDFIDLQPPGLWPENQDSNFGQVRKVVTDVIQDCVDEINDLSLEAFVATADDYLSWWEEIVRVPIAPAGKTLTERRTVAGARLHYGAFTRARLRQIVESFLLPTFGEAVTLTSGGVALTGGGVPLYSGATDMTGAYRIYEDVRNYAYEVWIKNTFSPNVSALLKEFQRVTPAGITVTVDNSKANVLDYFRTVRNKQPVAYYRMGTPSGAQDLSGYGNNAGTTVGTTTVAGLLHAAVAGSQGHEALDFDGVDDYMSSTHQPQLSLGDNFTVEAWIRIDALPASGQGGTILRKAGNVHLYIDQFGRVVFTDDADYNYILTNALSVGTVYHVVARRRAGLREVWINGVRNHATDFGEGANAPAASSSLPLYIGSHGASYFFNGVIDEVAIYNRVLSDAEVLENYRTGTNIQQAY